MDEWDSFVLMMRVAIKLVPSNASRMCAFTFCHFGAPLGTTSTSSEVDFLTLSIILPMRFVEPLKVSWALRGHYSSKRHSF